MGNPESPMLRGKVLAADEADVVGAIAIAMKRKLLRVKPTNTTAPRG